jgi:hypothetical protein
VTIPVVAMGLFPNQFFELAKAAAATTYLL